MADHFGIFHVAYQDNVKTHNHPRHIQVRQLKKDQILNLNNDLAVADYSSVLATNNTNDTYNNCLDIPVLIWSSMSIKANIGQKKIYKETTMDYIWYTYVV